jgi:NitT/TauT family transport system substrate-binding protein
MKLKPVRSPKKADRTTRAGAAIAALILILAGVPAAARAADRITITNYGVNLATLPWAVALERGLFQKEGVDVDGFIGSSGGGSAIRNMMASKIPFAEVSVPAAIAALQSGIDLKIVYGAISHFGDMSWMMRKDSPIRSIADLRGHKVAFTSPQSVSEMAVRMVLDAHHVANDVTFIAAGSVEASLVALDQSAVDAAPVEVPAFLVQPEKYKPLFRVSDELPNVVTQVGVVTSDYAKAHPDIVRKLVAVHRDALEYMNAHPDDAAKVYDDVWNASDKPIGPVLRRLLRDKYWSPGSIDNAGINNMLRGMRLVGALDKPVDLNAVIDREYLPADLRR